jgi:hypothetical protein
VEYDLGAALLEDQGDCTSVPDVGEDHVGRVEQGTAVDRELRRVQRGLVAVEHQQLRGTVPVDLPAQLRADRAAGTGDEHAPSGEIPADHREVDLHRTPAEQVGDVEVP